MSNPSFLTLADVRNWQAQLKQLVIEEEAMKKRHAEEEARIKNMRTRLDRLIEAATEFVNSISDGHSSDNLEIAPTTPQKQEKATDQKPGPAKRRTENQTWLATIQRIIRAADYGLTYAELKERLLETHLGEVLERTDKAFYGGVSKLESRQMLVKHGGRLYSPAAYKRFTENVVGRQDDDALSVPPSTKRSSPNEKAVIQLLSDHPRGLTTGQIVNSLLENPPPDLTVTRNKNSLYNLLIRGREKGNWLQDGEKYFLPRFKIKSSGS